MSILLEAIQDGCNAVNLSLFDLILNSWVIPAEAVRLRRAVFLSFSGPRLSPG